MFQVFAEALRFRSNSACLSTHKQPDVRQHGPRAVSDIVATFGRAGRGGFLNLSYRRRSTTTGLWIGGRFGYH
jgi:hypothetical protein